MPRFALIMLAASSPVTMLAQGTLVRVPQKPLGAPVTVAERAGGTYILANGILTVTLNGPDVSVSSIVYKGEEMVSQQSSEGSILWSLNSGTLFRGSAKANCTIKAATEELADVGCKHIYNRKASGPGPAPVDVEVHYVLRRNKPGVYAYAVLSHPASYPELRIGDWSMVWRTSPLLDKVFVDDKRHGMQRAAAEQGSPESRYSANYEENGAFGFASDRAQLGAWLVLGNYEYYNDGPHQQGLTASAGTITNELNRASLNGTPIHVWAGEEWSKIFGPFLLFFNSGLPADALWSDARAQALVEHGGWPYAWLGDLPQYPPSAGRGAVSGKLLVADAINPKIDGAYAWVGLAQPQPGLDFQSEANNYQYWVRAKADGTFSLRGVRPGTYTLYAYLDGEVGQHTRENVTVTAQSNNALGNITWTIPRTGSHFAWEIGFPNRDSIEFRHGDELFSPESYKRFPAEWPNPLLFQAGKSDSRKDWNYVQTLYVTRDGRAVPWKWTIRFSLASLPQTGDGLLVLALSGSNGAELAIDLNQKNLAHVRPKLDGGDALLSQSSYAKYSNYAIPVPVSRLKIGDNTIDLQMVGTHGAASAIFYDYLALEMP